MEIGMEMMIWMMAMPGRLCKICLLLWDTALHLLRDEYDWQLDGRLDWHWMNTWAAMGWLMVLCVAFWLQLAFANCTGYPRLGFWKSSYKYRSLLVKIALILQRSLELARLLTGESSLPGTNSLK